MKNNLSIIPAEWKYSEISTAKFRLWKECAFYDMEIQAEDGGALEDRTKVLISVEDVNDNRPEVTITSLASPVREDAPQGTIVLCAHDRDSGKNEQLSVPSRRFYLFS